MQSRNILANILKHTRILHNTTPFLFYQLVIDLNGEDVLMLFSLEIIKLRLQHHLRLGWAKGYYNVYYNAYCFIYGGKLHE